MIDPRGWVRVGMRLSALGLLGMMGAACATGSSTATTGTGGNGGDTSTGGAGAAGGMAGSGGAPCTPETEICDMKDNDCDGQVDNVAGLPAGCMCNDGTEQDCYSGRAGTEGVGQCKKGTQACQNGTWGECLGQVTPAAETCNGKDDDCNGTVDDGIPDVTCGVGACAATAPGCENGAPGTCVPGQPTVEVCDGIDNNCNQLTDETDPQLNTNCTTPLPGACAQGKYQCISNTLQCVGAMPVDEVCDAIDNDCDGIVDNVTGTGGMCSTGAPGVCSPGLISCQFVGGMWTIDCFSIVPASQEVCDGLDNNCNGTSDENDPGGGGGCATGQPGVCAPGTNHCVSGAIQCVPNVAAQPETCNLQDDNCNGAVDEGNPGGGIGCSTGVPGICATGVTNCQNGAVVCTQTVMAQAETCNGIDDNCNGLVDDGNPGGGAACSTGLLGACAAGTMNCVGGQVICQQNVAASPEICGNAIDENCDGIAPPAPTSYFSENFANNSKGWTLGTNWQIGPAVVPTCGVDPSQDHSPTADNGVAGVVIGGCAPTTPIMPAGTFNYMTSPAINTSAVAGPMYLSFWRYLTSDYDPFMHNIIEISTNNGSTWTTLPHGLTGGCCGVMDNAWTNHGDPTPGGPAPIDAAHYPTQFDITAYKSATMRIRFGYNVTSSGVYTIGSWNIDDIEIVNTICN